ncbi:MAG: hypothetical protein ACREJB_14225 [Planctomycetaceae bacterium]
MQRLPLLWTSLTVMLLAATVAAGEPKDEAKTKQVKIKDLTLAVPESWEQQEPSSRLRLGQFVIPKAEGDEAESELSIFSFAGGGGAADANIERWIGQFDAEGRMAKITKGKSEQGPYYFVDLSGTYNMPVGPPIQRQTKKMPDSRMLGVILDTEGRGVYYLKHAGPKKSITAAAAAYRQSYGADPATEEEYKPGE